MVRLIAAAAGLAVAGSALAGIAQPWLSYQIVDNGGVSDGSGQNLTGTTTLDLYWTNNFGNTVGVNGFNLGSAAVPDLDPYRIFVHAPVYNHPLGGDVRSTAFEGVFPTIAFDTYLAFGDVAAGNITVVAGTADLTGTNGELVGTWATLPPVQVAAGESIRFMRLTLVGSFDENNIGDGLDLVNSFMQIGFADNTVGVYSFVPTPGAAALLGLGGLAAARRRR